MSRPTSACAYNQQISITVANKEAQTIVCSRGEGHRGDHYARIAWPPRLAAPPGHHTDRTGG